MSDAQKRLRTLAISDTGFLFDPITGHTYTLNRTACDIVAWLREGVLERDIPTRLVEDYDVTAAEADHDSGVFLRQLREYRLIES